MNFIKEKNFFPKKMWNILPIYNQNSCMAQTVKNIRCLLKPIF